MSRFSTFVWVIVIVALSLAACGGGTAGIGTVQVGEKDAGQQVELIEGDRLEVALPGNPTTGYSWEVESVDEAVLKQAGEWEFKADSQAAGAGGIITVPFKAVGAGQTSLKLIYHRPFEEGVEPLGEYAITVIVK